MKTSFLEILKQFRPQKILIPAHGFEKDLTIELDQFKNDYISEQNNLQGAKDLLLDAQPNYLEHNQMFFVKNSYDFKPAWVQSVWENIEIISIQSIKDAAQILKKRKKYWYAHSYQLHRRTELITEQLPKFKDSSLKIGFLHPLVKHDYGVFCLLDPNHMLIAQNVNSIFPMGDAPFIEDKINPPSRAYLKLWEVFTLHQIRPQAGDVCVELGAAPGGWTWVLNNLNCEVFSFDRAPLDARFSQNKMIHHQIKDAFQVKPKELPKKVKWFFSDLICDPNKLYDYLENNWDFQNSETNFICTLKFKGETDFESIQKFKKIKNANVIHLFHNKHELTFMLYKKELENGN